MSKCDTCINKKYCANNLDARTACQQMDYVLFTPAYETNYDLLISKTPEELARWIAENTGCSDWCHLSEQCAKNHEIDEAHCCITEWYNWLKAPADKEGER